MALTISSDHDKTGPSYTGRLNFVRSATFSVGLDISVRIRGHQH